MTLFDSELLEDLEDPLTLAELSEQELDDLFHQLITEFESVERPGLLPHQVPPDDWARAWIILGGRGAGKTQGATVAFKDHLDGPACDHRLPGGHRMGIIAPTLGDAISSVVEGPSGLRALDPSVRVVTKTGGTFVKFAGGVEARVFSGFSAEDARRLRAGGNMCFVLVEELAAIRQLGAVWAQMRLGLRLGPHPRIVGSTTPRARPIFNRILNDVRTVTTHGTTRDNPHLSAELVAELHEMYEGTRLEKQELLGMLLENIEGALWSQEDLDQRRITHATIRGRTPQMDELPEMWLRRALNLTTVLVSVDPATSGKGDETGLVVVGGDSPRLHPDGKRDAFILEDKTFLATSDVWAEAAAEIAYRWQADGILVEENRLGTTAEAVIRGAGYNNRIDSFSTSESKENRADSVRAAWLKKCWIVGTHPKLENQMTSWVPADGDKVIDPDPDDPDAFSGSPDALDAGGHGIRKLLGLGTKPKPKKGRSIPMGDVMSSGWGNR